VLGLIRDAACGYFLGVGGVSSAFWVAFQIPNLFRRLFGEGALSAAFIPVFSDYHHAGDREGARRVAGCVVGLLLVVLAASTLVGEAIVGGMWWFGTYDERTRLTLSLTAVMLPFMLLICTTATLGGLLNVLGRFAVPALTPVVMNVCMIAAVVVGGAWAGVPEQRLVYGVAIAVLVAGGLQVAMHWVALRKGDYAFRLALDRRHEGVRRIVRTMGPMVLGLGAVQVNTLADTLIAYWFVEYEGAPTVLYYAHRLYDFPLGVFGIALVTAVFAELARLSTLNDMAGFGRTVQKGMQLVLFVGVPASAGLILVRAPLAAFLFQRGAFDADGIERVARTVMFYAAGVWAFGCQHVFIRSFYALKDSRTPMKIAAAMILLNVPLNLVLVGPMEESGLALSTAICAVIQVILLARILVARVGHVDWRAVWRSVTRTAAATIVMTLAVTAIDAYGMQDPYVGVRLAVLVIVGVLSFVIAAYVIRHEELHVLVRRR